METLLVLGAGGLGRVVGEIALETGLYDRTVYLDDAVRGGEVIGKCGDYRSLVNTFPSAIAAFGDNRLRLFWTQKLQDAGFSVPTLVHPRAYVSPCLLYTSALCPLQ